MGAELFKKIKRYDNVLTPEEFNEALKCIDRPSWTLMHSGSEEDGHDKKLTHAFWRMNLMQDPFFTQHVFQKICNITKNILELVDVYMNGTTTSMCSAAHVDAREDNVYIFMLYMNPEWYIQWGGQTIFCDKYWDTKLQRWNNGTSDTVSYFPKPNSALYFPGNIIHIADAPSREFWGLRTTLAYRVKKVR